MSSTTINPNLGVVHVIYKSKLFIVFRSLNSKLGVVHIIDWPELFNVVKALSS